MKPVAIRKTPSQTLSVTWEDRHTTDLPLKFLRDECPCAGCKGETLLLGKRFAPASLPVFQPGMYDLAKLEQVGNYGIQAWWKDGHDTGIYTWDYLLLLEEQLRTSDEETGGVT